MKTKYDTTMERIENLANGNDLMTTAMDLISREDAIRWVKTECNPYGKPTLDFESGKKIIEHLEQMPSAQPERKKGKWIQQDHNKTNGIASTLVYYYPKCSVCGHCDNYTNFCSNCGADMRDNITYADEQCLEFADVPTLANAT